MLTNRVSSITVCSFLLLLVLSLPSTAQWVRAWPDSQVVEGQAWDVSQVVLCLASSGGTLFAGSDYWNGFLRSTDAGGTWIRLDPLGTFVGAWGVADSNLYQWTLAGSLGRVYRSTNSGDSWTEADNGLSDAWVEGFAFDGTFLYAGTGWNGLFRSSNNGSSWTQVTGASMGTSLKSFAVAEQAIFVTGSDGFFRSTDGGTSWVVVGSGLPNGGRNAFIAANGPILFAGAGGVFRSTDYGVSWTVVLSGSLWTSSILVSDNIVFAGTNVGVFWSSDNGTTWRGSIDGLPTTVWQGTISALAASGQNLLAATWMGIYRAKLSYVTGVGKATTDLPEIIKLDQNYPNPFNPSTTIRYGLPHKSAVQLSVYNTLGQSVSTLVNGEQEGGYHEVQFDGSGLSSGMYFYRLEAGSFVQTRKLVLLR